MKSSNQNFFNRTVFVLIAAVLLSSCVTKQTKDESPTSGPSPVTSQPSTPPPSSSGDVTSTPIPSARELRGPITLVLGGAGVASFATVGVLKKIQEEGIKVESIIVTGWPAIFAVGYGTMKSVHDLEWFAMKLEQSDFSSGGLFGSNSGFSDHDRIQGTLSKAFGNSNLNQTKIPIVLSTSNSSTGQAEVYSSGGLLEPLLKALSVPGTFRPYGDGPGLGWVSTLNGLDVEEAQRRGAKNIVAISMYDDYLVSLQDTRSAEAETLFRNIYGAQLNKNLRTAMKRATVGSQIRLSRPPNDFSAKRLAIQAGYQEASKLLRSLSAKKE